MSDCTDSSRAFLRTIAGLTLAALLAGCLEQPRAPAPPPPPQFDGSTPDRAIKSYWAIKDWEQKAIKTWLAMDDPTTVAVWEQRALVLTDKLLRSKQEGRARYAVIQIYEREIQEVKVESDSRAVVVATVRNTTPLPADLRLSASDEQERTGGSRVKYVLEKGNKGWQVAELWTPEYSGGTFTLDEPTASHRAHIYTAASNGR